MSYPAQWPEWMIMTRRNDVIEDIVGTTGSVAGAFTCSVEGKDPPNVSVPGLHVLFRTLGPDRRRPVLHTFASPMMVMRYPPILEDGTGRTLAGERYVIKNYSLVEEKFSERFSGLEDMIEVRHFPDAYFDRFRTPGVVAHPTCPGYFALAGLRARLDDNHEVVREICTFVHDSTTRYPGLACWKLTTAPGREQDLDWSWDDVVAAGGTTIAWFDNRQGIFIIDPFSDSDDVEVTHIALPDAPHASLQRALQYSEGSFHLVEIFSDAAQVKVTVRAFQAGAWAHRFTFSLDEIWATRKFKESGIPAKNNGVPRFAIMSPLDASELFFLTTKLVAGETTTWLYRVNGQTKVLVDSHHKDLAAWLDADADFRSVRAWMAPRTA